MKFGPAFWFYSGTLLSSVGSFVFNICMIAFMTKAGYGLFEISLILGLQRLIPLLITGLAGHLTDRIAPRLNVVLSEFIAAVTTLGILWAWSEVRDAYFALLAFTVLKASVVAFQAGSRAKITKLLSESSYQSNAKNAIWFNKATQGAMLFAGVCAWPIIIYADFQTAIWFDLLTFAVNGLIVYFLPIGKSQSGTPTVASSILGKFRDFYRFNPRAAVLDLFLALSMMGTTSFTARLAADDQHWMAILFAGYGLAVWIAGYMERYELLKHHSRVLWAGLAFSYAVVGFFPGSGFLTAGLTLSKDIFYWLLLHRISSHIQMDTPESNLGSVTSARVTQMIFILASGELLVGSYAKALPVWADGLWRGIFCLLVLAGLSLACFKSEGKLGYARL